MTYQIYLKDKPVLVEPCTRYNDRETAEYWREVIELQQPSLEGQLEVRLTA